MTRDLLVAAAWHAIASAHAASWEWRSLHWHLAASVCRVAGLEAESEACDRNAAHAWGCRCARCRRALSTG